MNPAVWKTSHLAAVRLLRVLLKRFAATFEQRHPLALAYQLHRQQNARRTRAHNAHIGTRAGIWPFLYQVPNQRVRSAMIFCTRSMISPTWRSLWYPLRRARAHPAAAIRVRDASSGR